MGRLIWVFLMMVLLFAGPVRGVDLGKDVGWTPPIARDWETPEWVEEQATPPVFPKEADLIEFYVSAVTANRFFIDGKTLRVGKDGIVRYALVVKTAGGATNTTYEGIRCDTGEYRLYASGRADGTWAAARMGQWRAIENKPVNRHHAVLNRELFCPLAMPIDSVEDGLNALRRGKHPRAS